MKPNIERAIEILGDQAMNVQRLAMLVGVEKSTVLVWARNGLLAIAGYEKPTMVGLNRNPRGLTIVCAPAFAKKHRRAA